jgi:serine/threonine-protein kinase
MLDGLGMAIALNNLATVVEARGDYPRAEAAYRESLAIRERLLPPDHSHVLKLRGNLAALFLRQGDRERSVEMLETVIAARRRRGSSAFDLAAPLSNYGLALRGLGRPGEADIALEEATDLMAGELGGDHPTLAFPLTNRAGALADLGRVDEAEELLRRALEIRANAYPEGHRLVADSLHLLATFLIERSRIAEAAELAEEAVTMQSGLGDSRLARSQLLLALLNLERERWRESEDLARQVVRAVEAGPDAAAPDSAELDPSRCLLARALEKGGSDPDGPLEAICEVVTIDDGAWGAALWRKWLGRR